MAGGKSTQAESEAYRDGWNAADGGAPRTSRPNYQTHLEREAFNAGWDARAERQRKERQWQEAMDLLTPNDDPKDSNDGRP
jgi:hypothetical protein